MKVQPGSQQAHRNNTHANPENLGHGDILLSMTFFIFTAVATLPSMTPWAGACVSQ
tara:strand:+ start:801 stop:968 length:168 start_codon:yes stop_codon:yes gene_type:complete